MKLDIIWIKCLIKISCFLGMQKGFCEHIGLKNNDNNIVIVIFFKYCAMKLYWIVLLYKRSWWKTLKPLKNSDSL